MDRHLSTHSARYCSRFFRIIAFRFIPNSVVTKPVAAVWSPLVAKPFNRLPRHVKLGLGWLALLAIVFGSAFGFPLPQVSSCSMRCTSGAGNSNGFVTGNNVRRSCHLSSRPLCVSILLLGNFPQPIPGPVVGSFRYSIAVTGS